MTPMEWRDRVHTLLRQYGSKLAADDRIMHRNRTHAETGLKVVRARNRYQVRDAKTDQLYFTGSTPESIGSFVEKFWSWTKVQ